MPSRMDSGQQGGVLKGDSFMASLFQSYGCRFREWLLQVGNQMRFNMFWVLTSKMSREMATQGQTGHRQSSWYMNGQTNHIPKCTGQLFQDWQRLKDEGKIVKPSQDWPAEMDGNGRPGRNVLGTTSTRMGCSIKRSGWNDEKIPKDSLGQIPVGHLHWNSHIFWWHILSATTLSVTSEGLWVIINSFDGGCHSYLYSFDILDLDWHGIIHGPCCTSWQLGSTDLHDVAGVAMGHGPKVTDKKYSRWLKAPKENP